MLYFLSNIMMAKLHSSNHDEKKTAFLKNVFDSCLYQFVSVHSIHFNFVKDSKLQCKKMSFSFISLPEFNYQMQNKDSSALFDYHIYIYIIIYNIYIYHKVIVRNGRVHCFHNCIYITPILLL